MAGSILFLPIVSGMVDYKTNFIINETFSQIFCGYKSMKIYSEIYSLIIVALYNKQILITYFCEIKDIVDRVHSSWKQYQVQVDDICIAAC